MDYSNGLFDCQSPTSPFLGGLRVLHLLEDLRGALELMDNEERDNLRCQIPDSTAEGLAEWLHGRLVNHTFYVCGGPKDIVLVSSDSTDRCERAADRCLHTALCSTSVRKK